MKSPEVERPAWKIRRLPRVPAPRRLLSERTLKACGSIEAVDTEKTLAVLLKARG